MYREIVCAGGPKDKATLAVASDCHSFRVDYTDWKIREPVMHGPTIRSAIYRDADGGQYWLAGRGFMPCFNYVGNADGTMYGLELSAYLSMRLNAPEID